MDIRSAARLAGMSSDEFAALNAAFPRKLIRSAGPVNLLVPVAKTDTFQRNLETGSWDSWQPYPAQKGERPETIARCLCVSLASLEEHNQFHLKRGRLVREQVILVPVRKRGTAAASVDSPLPVASNPTQLVVGGGDTLYSIARHYGLTVAELGDANPGLDGRLTAGQTLRLPSEQPDQMTASHLSVAYSATRIAKPAIPSRYIDQTGDTQSAIARRI